MARPSSRPTEGPRSSLPATAVAEPEAKGRGKESEKVRPEEGHRETVEAIVVAFILALLVRGFAAEAFVIPTGSMAPTLMGRHKEITCPQCGYLYAINAAEEVEGPRAGTPEGRVSTGICVNCRYQASVGSEVSFKGDRILVMKFPYEFPSLPFSSGPKRWDVVVFRYPEKPDDSYIKRLVGLPGDTVRVWHGNLLVKPQNAEEFALERRPLYHQQAMQMMVYDDSLRAKALRDRPEWKRWTSDQETAWTEDASNPGTYALELSKDEAVLRYRHMVPDPLQWKAIEAGETLSRAPKPTLITDFYSYNTNLPARYSDLTGRVDREHQNAWNQPHWVGDLTLSAHVDIESGEGEFTLILVEGGVIHRCMFDVKNGTMVIYRGEDRIRRELSPIKGPGSHDIEFANVDNRLTVWVDGSPLVGDGVPYEDASDDYPEPTQEDLSPARVSARGAKLRVSGLVLKRDIYYTLTPGESDYSYGRSWNDPLVPRTPLELADLLADPSKVAALGPLPWVDYPVGTDRFMMMGDNSPRSKDGRGWTILDRLDESHPQGWDGSGRESWEVPRKMLTGKAFSVYWPHGKPFGPDIRPWADFRVPFRPYFERMKWIH